MWWLAGPPRTHMTEKDQNMSKMGKNCQSIFVCARRRTTVDDNCLRCWLACKRTNEKKSQKIHVRVCSQERKNWNCIITRHSQQLLHSKQSPRKQWWWWYVFHDSSCPMGKNTGGESKYTLTGRSNERPEVCSSNIQPPRELCVMTIPLIWTRVKTGFILGAYIF